jgi:hypothetical protein
LDEQINPTIRTFGSFTGIRVMSPFPANFDFSRAAAFLALACPAARGTS